MPANILDKNTYVGNPGTITSLQAPGKALAATTISIGSASNWPTASAVFFAMRRVDPTLVTTANTSGTVPNTYTEWKGTLAGTTISNLQIQAGFSDQVYPAGTNTQVFITISAARENSRVDWGLAHADQLGALLPAAVIAALGTGNLANTGYNALGYTPTTVTYNGNRSYDLTFNGTDLTGVLSEGMRMRTTRTTLPQTQVSSLNGTTHFWSKASPANMAFTSAFTCSAWIKPTSYKQAGIISRFNGTTGWILYLNASGQLNIYGSNGTTRIFNSYQSVPLNKWTHVSGSLDMSGGIGSLYIDGVLVPGVSFGGAGTALVQAGNLEVGSDNGTDFFPGKIAQPAVFSTVLSAATIKSYYSQGLSGTETSLISAYSFNGNANDLNTTNANNLTANSGVTATNADSPFSTGTGTNLTSGFDYAIVMAKPVFATNTTVTVSVPENCAIPTSGGVSAVVYSSQAVPFGFPKEEDKWTLDSIFQSSYGQSSPVANTVYNPLGIFVTAPAGKFIFSHRGSTYTIRAGSGIADIKVLFGTSTITNNILETTVGQYITNAGTIDSIINSSSSPVGINNAAAQAYYLQIVTSTAGLTTIAYRGDLGGPLVVKLKNAYI